MGTVLIGIGIFVKDTAAVGLKVVGLLMHDSGCVSGSLGMFVFRQ